MIVSEYQYTKTFLRKDILKTGQEKFLSSANVISDLNGELITGSFYEKELQKLVKKNLE